MQADEVLQRYRRIRAITVAIHAAAMKRVSQTSLMQHGRRLGVVHGKVFQMSDEETFLLMDLVIHAGQRGRPRPIDRCKPPGDDAETAAVLQAIRKSRFSLWAVERPHHVAGLMLRDLIRREDVWLMDEALTATMPLDMTFASRVFWPGEFALTCGVVVPVDIRGVLDTIAECSGWMSQRDEDFTEDPRFATAIYRTAIELGSTDLMEHATVPEAA
jgi:hypothetical protein